jgi:hypothetical protein
VQRSGKEVQALKSLRRFWLAYRQARRLGFTRYNAYLAARTHR